MHDATHCECAMCTSDRHPIPRPIDSARPELLATLMGGAFIGFGLWAGLAVTYLAGKWLASIAGWWPLLWILVGVSTTAGLWSETTGRRRR